MLSLKGYRDTAKGLADLLQWAGSVDDGIVINKDGSLMAGYVYQPPDMSSASAEDFNDLTARVNRALSRFGKGWAMWADAHREAVEAYPARESSHFPDQVSRMIDREREKTFRSAGQFYETRYTLILQWRPPSRAGRRIQRLLFSEDDAKLERPGDVALTQFKRALEQFEDSLALSLKMARLGYYAVEDKYGREYRRCSLVDQLDTMLKGEPSSLNLPEFYLDAIMGGREFWGGERPKLDDKFIVVVAIEGFPGESFPGILDVLDGLPMEARWSSRFIFLDAVEAAEELERYRKRWAFKVQDFKAQLLKIQNAPVNEDAMLMTAETSRARSQAESGLVAYGYYTPVIVLTGENWPELEEKARYIIREVRRGGFSARIETVNAMEAWHGSLPGHAFANVRRPLIHTLNLVDLMPMSSIWAGSAVAPCPFYPANSPPLFYAATGGSTPFRFNQHVDDVGHTLVFGPTGAGKSVWLATTAVQFLRYPGATVFAFDKGRSLFASCLATGGRHYEISPDAASDGSSGMLCPLYDLSGEADVAWAAEWIETCYKLQTGGALTPAQRTEVLRALNLLRQGESRSITDFVATVQDDEVRDAMKFYTLTHPMGPLLDGLEDKIETSSYFQVFEIDALLEMGERAVIPVLSYLFRKIEKTLKGQPALIIIDEAWVALAHPTFREKLYEWLKTFRKLNASVDMATQGLGDAVRSGMLDVIREACPRIVFLANPEAGKEGIIEYYRALGLNARQIEIIRTAERKREYYVTGPEGARLIELALGPVALSFVAVSDKPRLQEIKVLAEKHPNDWQFLWLRQQGVDYHEYFDG